jgi:hypothetical protein
MVYDDVFPKLKLGSEFHDVRRPETRTAAVPRTEARTDAVGAALPGQLWKHEDIRAIIVAVSPTTVSYEDLSRSRAVTKNLGDFLDTFRRMKR